jgi:hypothetical protein
MAIFLDNKPIKDFGDTKEVINVLNCSSLHEVKNNLFLIKTNGETFLKEKVNTWKNNPVFEFNVLIGSKLHKNIKFVVSEKNETKLNHQQLGIDRKPNGEEKPQILKEKTQLLAKVSEPEQKQESPVNPKLLKKMIFETFTSLVNEDLRHSELEKFFDVYTEGFKQQFMQISEKISKREIYRAMESGGGTNAKQFAKGGVMEGDLTITGNLSVTGNTYINLQPPDEVAKKIVLNVGDGLNTVYVLTHNLNTKDILVSILDTETNKVVYPLVEYTTVNSITLTFENIVSLDAYRAVIIG